MTGLPWDDPNRDIGADLVETTAHWIAAPQWPGRRDVELAARFLGHVYLNAWASVDAALKSINDAAKLARTWTPILDDFNQRATADGKIDLTRRRPLYGQRITHHDLDVDQHRIADAFEEGLRRPQPVTLRTRDDVLRYGELEDRMGREQNRTWNSSRAAGKNTTQERLKADLQAWVGEFQRTTGQKATAASVGRDGMMILDETHGWIDVNEPEPSPWLTAMNALEADWHAEAERNAQHVESRLRTINPHVHWHFGRGA